MHHYYVVQGQHASVSCVNGIDTYVRCMHIVYTGFVCIILDALTMFKSSYNFHYCRNYLLHLVVI